MLTPKKVFIWLILSRFCVIISENAGNASFNFVHWSAVNELSVVTAVLVLLQSTVFPYISLRVSAYPETDEMNTELNDQAENYYNMYNQYYGYSKEEFLTKSGFGSERAFIEYLRLQYRRTQYTDDYIKEQITDKEIEKYYEDKVYGDINTKHILVKVSSSATDEEKKEAENLAKEIITKLNEGKSFDEVKDEYKDKITYEELGYKAYNASLESAYMEAMQKLENNSYTKEPVQTSYGYHVIYRIDQKEKPALKDVKEEIITSLVSEHKSKDTSVQYKALDKMREDAKLKFTDTVLEKKYETYKSQYNK